MKIQSTNQPMKQSSIFTNGKLIFNMSYKISIPLLPWNVDVLYTSSYSTNLSSFL